MPNIKSVEKRMRQSIKRNEVNTSTKTQIKTIAKNTITLANENKADESKASLSKYYKFIDKASGKGIIKKNQAARKKSGLNSLVKKTLAENEAAAKSATEEKAAPAESN